MSRKTRRSENSTVGSAPDEKKIKIDNTKKMYDVNESVVCFDGGPRGSQSHYFAKVIDVKQSEKGEYQYYIHWDGWNKRFDEWMLNDDVRLMKKNTETSTRVADDKMARANKRKSKTTKKSNEDRGPDSRANSPTNMSSQDSVVSESTRKKELKKVGGNINKIPPVYVEAPSLRIDSVNIDIPKQLKDILVDDSDNVNGEECLLVRFPTKFTVQHIINDYVEYVKTCTNDENSPGTTSPFICDQLIENSKNIQQFFDLALFKQLLYKLERPQYHDLIEKHANSTDTRQARRPGADDDQLNEENGHSMIKGSAHYGFIHLVRLLVKLGTYLVKTSMATTEIQISQRCCKHFTDFLLDNVCKYYKGRQDYDAATLNYQKRAYETHAPDHVAM